MMCILQSKYDCYRYIFPIRFCCKHSNTNFSQKPCFKLSKILLTLSWIQYVLTFIPVAAYFVNLPSVCQRDQYLCVFLISDQVFGVSSLLLGGTILFKLETQRQELAFWLSLFENHNSYNLGPIICGDDLKKFQLYRLLSSYSFLVEGILSFLIYFYALENNLPWTFLKQASLCFACSLQGKGLFELSKKIALIGAILKAFQTSPKTTLINRSSVRTVSKSESLIDVFKKYQHFIRTFNLNVVQCMKSMTTVFFLWFVILIKYFDYNSQSMIWMQIRTLYVIIGIVTILIQTENHINRKVSYLYACCIFFFVFFLTIYTTNNTGPVRDSCRIQST